MGDDGGSVKVCVRVRPFIKEELSGERGGGQCKLCIEMPTKTTVVITGKDEPRDFTYDRCYWSHSEDHPLFATQDMLYEELGCEMLTQALSGWNNCIFAYGQTGSGKSFSVLGAKKPGLEGLLPRIVKGLFEHFEVLPEGTEAKCVVCFEEVYNEQILDLLRDQNAEPIKLEVRQHPQLGSFIPGLTEVPVDSREQVLDLIDYGTGLRQVASTAMNNASSRSHCIFTFKNTLIKDGVSKMSQTHLVDLAGSERSAKTGATGDTAKEGAAINKSLSTLARVISELAKIASKGKKAGNPPFRDSKLTHILKESLCGNSKTVMMAAISPNLPDYDETLSTMKFCQAVKMVKTAAKCNEVSAKGLTAQLKAQLAQLKEEFEKLKEQKAGSSKTLEAMQSKLKAHAEIVDRHCGDWSEHVAKGKDLHETRKASILDGGDNEDEWGSKVARVEKTDSKKKQKPAIEPVGEEGSGDEEDDSEETDGDGSSGSMWTPRSSESEGEDDGGVGGDDHDESKEIFYHPRNRSSALISGRLESTVGAKIYPIVLMLRNLAQMGKGVAKELGRAVRDTDREVERVVDSAKGLSKAEEPGLDLKILVAVPPNAQTATVTIRATKIVSDAPEDTPPTSMVVLADELNERSVWLQEQVLEQDLEQMSHIAEQNDEEVRTFASPWEAWVAAGTATRKGGGGSAAGIRDEIDNGRRAVADADERIKQLQEEIDQLSQRSTLMKAQHTVGTLHEKFQVPIINELDDCLEDAPKGAKVWTG